MELWTAPATGAHRGHLPRKPEEHGTRALLPCLVSSASKRRCQPGRGPLSSAHIALVRTFQCGCPLGHRANGKRGPCPDHMWPPATGPPGAVRSLGAQLVAAVAVHHISFPQHDLLCLTSVPPGFPGGPGVGTLPVNAGGVGSVCDPGRPRMPRGS